jgi:serine/threonine protein kinase
VALVIPGVELGNEVGRGAFGVVYRGRQPAFEREVAVKVLLVSGLDARQGERFSRELAAMGKLSWHPNIVTVYSAGLTGNREPYIVMEYLPGGSLGARLKTTGPMSPQQVLEIGVRLASALETAHRAHILHRDVKPENVLLSRLGEPKLTDFGIAQVEGLHSTRTGVTHMSIAHAPPELINSGTSNAATDVYALASTLATLLLGHAPYVERDSDQLGTVIGRIVTGPVPNLAAKGIAPAVAAPLSAALAKTPEGRPATALGFAERLTQAQRTMGFPQTTILVEPTEVHESVPPPPLIPLIPEAVQPGPPPPPDVPTDTLLIPGPLQEPLPPAPPKRSRRPLVLGIVTALVATIAAAAVVLAVTRAPSPPAPIPTPCVNCGGTTAITPVSTPVDTSSSEATTSPTPSLPPSQPTYLMNIGIAQSGSNNDPPSARGKTSFNGQTYSSSLLYYGDCCPASYDTSYDINGEFSQFTATLGIADHVGTSCNPQEQATFQVKLDGITLDTENLPTGVSKPITVDISGGQTLELVTIIGTDDDQSCDAVWGNAEILP